MSDFIYLRASARRSCNSRPLLCRAWAYASFACLASCRAALLYVVQARLSLNLVLTTQQHGQGLKNHQILIVVRLVVVLAKCVGKKNTVRRSPRMERRIHIQTPIPRCRYIRGSLHGQGIGSRLYRCGCAPNHLSFPRRNKRGRVF